MPNTHTYDAVLYTPGVDFPPNVLQVQIELQPLARDAMRKVKRTHLDQQWKDTISRASRYLHPYADEDGLALRQRETRRELWYRFEDAFKGLGACYADFADYERPECRAAAKAVLAFVVAFQRLMDAVRPWALSDEEPTAVDETDCVCTNPLVPAAVSPRATDPDSEWATTPPFSADDGRWVSNKLAADLEGLDTRTLATYRHRGKQKRDGTVGTDRDGRIWRRTGTQTSHPRYLRSSLRSQKNHVDKP